MYIKVFVTPGAKREKIERKDETFAISVREPAAGNRANNRVREIIAAQQGIPFSKVQILTGHRSRAKMISING